MHMWLKSDHSLKKYDSFYRLLTVDIKNLSVQCESKNPRAVF